MRIFCFVISLQHLNILYIRICFIHLQSYQDTINLPVRGMSVTCELGLYLYSQIG